MPTTLSETLTYTSAVAVPADSDDRDAASVQTGFQALANRTAYLKNRCDVAGVRRLYALSDLTALAATTDQADGDFVVVNNIGLYQFKATSFSPPDGSPLYVVVSSGTAGYWRLCAAGNGTRNIANGFAGLNADAKLPTANMQNAVVGSYYDTNTGALQTITAAGRTAVSGLTFTMFGLKTGDYVHVDASMAMTVTGVSGEYAAAILRVGAVDVADTSINALATGAGFRTLAIAGARYTIPSDGGYTVDIEIANGTSGGTIEIGNGTFGGSIPASIVRALVIRP